MRWIEFSLLFGEVEAFRVKIRRGRGAGKWIPIGQIELGQRAMGSRSLSNQMANDGTRLREKIGFQVDQKQTPMAESWMGFCIVGTNSIEMSKDVNRRKFEERGETGRNEYNERVVVMQVPCSIFMRKVTIKRCIPDSEGRFQKMLKNVFENQKVLSRKLIISNK